MKPRVHGLFDCNAIFLFRDGAVKAVIFGKIGKIVARARHHADFLGFWGIIRSVNATATGRDMEGAREFLEQIRQHQLVKGHFRGLLHLLVGRTIARADGTVLSNGLTWRQLAELLKALRWDRENVRELGLNPDDLPPRERQRFWYSAIVSAQIDSPEAAADADKLSSRAKSLGFVVAKAVRK